MPTTDLPPSTLRARFKSAALYAILVAGLATSALWASAIGFLVFDGLFWLFM